MLVWRKTGPVPICFPSICPQSKREPKLPIDMCVDLPVADSSTACMARRPLPALMFDDLTRHPWSNFPEALKQAIPFPMGGYRKTNMTSPAHACLCSYTTPRRESQAQKQPWQLVLRTTSTKYAISYRTAVSPHQEHCSATHAFAKTQISVPRKIHLGSEPWSCLRLYLSLPMPLPS